MSTYLLLLIIALLIINLFVYKTIKNSYISENRTSFVTQGSILANRLKVPLDEEKGEFNQLQVNQMMEEVSRLIEGRAMIINRDGTVIYDSFHTLKDQQVMIHEVERALKGETITNIYELEEFDKTMYVSVPVVYTDRILGVVFLSMSLEDTFQRIDGIRNFLIGMSIAALAIVTIISLIFADLIAGPIKTLTEVMQKAAHGNMNERVEIKGNDEISQLAKAYNTMSTKLSHIERQRQEFVGNVSHELKTPLSSMKLLSESLLTQPSNNVEIYQEFLRDIDSEIDRLNEIIESLLTMVDLNEEKLKLEYSLTYVNYLVERVVAAMKPLADKKNIKLFINQWEKIQIQLDPGKVYQALMNIVHNAIKYTDEGGRVHINIYREAKYVVIRVIDNGIGIPEESLPHIFERFYRVDSARSRKTGGTGLGLSISQQIIGLHQGIIEVESKVNEGTIFYIKLPMELG